MNRILRLATMSLAASILAACSSVPVTPAASKPGLPYKGKYYLNDGPLAGVTQEMIDAVSEPTPRREPLSKGAMKPYSRFGVQYTPMTSLAPFHQQGIGSWYGTKYHNQKGAIGEVYDMLKLTAAHPTLPLPSYARVTNLENGKSVIVRVNDRGPFLHDRVIDLSYAAAAKLGYAKKGSALLDVELLIP